ncbi:MAG: hypothetical protein IJ532_07110, partial [Alphaproteobacteria bacterium]|nr:hypothetical protein [Alphaproteobacteria bacterium]
MSCVQVRLSPHFPLRALGCLFFAAVAVAFLAQKQPSPVVQKQHFEVVFVSPARSSFKSRIALMDTNKKEEDFTSSFFIGDP